MVRLQVAPLPAHGPDQLENRIPACGTAVNVPAEPLGTVAEQILPQSMPKLPVTEPLPDVFAWKTNVGANVAVTFIAF